MWELDKKRGHFGIREVQTLEVLRYSTSDPGGYMFSTVFYFSWFLSIGFRPSKFCGTILYFKGFSLLDQHFYVSWFLSTGIRSLLIREGTFFHLLYFTLRTRCIFRTEY